MSFLSRFFRTLGLNKTARRRGARPALEPLEDRCVPSTGWSSIASNFNGTAIGAGDSVWFSSVFKVNGLGSNPVSLHVTNQTISFSANGTNYNLNVPDDSITISPTATSATTSFDTGTNSWVTSLPVHYSGNGFLGGDILVTPSGLPGGIKNVVWAGQFSSDTAGISVNWQWAAAVYKSFSTDYNALKVKPVDDNQVSPYKNSDHAGTPEAFTISGILPGGGTGGGGSNWTGSYSGTASVTPEVVTESPASISGFVFNGTQGGVIAGVTITLTELVNGQSVFIASTTTTANGSFSFGNLQPGIYTITETLPRGVSSVTSSASGGANANGNVISNINLSAGTNANNFNFTDVFAGS
jgi:hypothetical protein